MKNMSFAVIGGGPSGFYTAKLLSKLPCAPQIHIYEKQLCPFGLIRYGVAPDHISIKKSQIVLSEVTSYQNFRYIGNKSINSQILQDLKQKYSGVIMAYGASGDTAPSSKLLKETKDASSIIKVARQLVYWYNNHPDYQNYHVDLSNIKNVTIIGNGNVAIDIGRIFSRSPQQLSKTQISLNALQSLKNSSIKNINVIARRGVVQSAFALKEIRELTKCKIKLYTIRQELEASLNDSSYHEYTAIGDNFSNVIRMNKRKLDFIKEHTNIISIQQLPQILENGQKKIILRYLLNPKQLSDDHKTLTLQRTFLYGEPFKQSCKETDQLVQIQHDLLVFSTGFQVKNLEGDFLKGNKIPNSNGCLLKNDQKINLGFYASGWCKTGPQGVIDQTLLGCEQTFNNIRIHYQNNILEPKSHINISDVFNQNQNINFDQYKKIRQIELAKGDEKKYIKKKLSQKEILDLYGLSE